MEVMLGRGKVVAVQNALTLFVLTVNQAHRAMVCAPILGPHLQTRRNDKSIHQKSR